MKVLMILEPVGFREGESFLTHHLFWVEAIYNAVRQAGGVMVLATNSVLCDRWQSRGVAGERPCHVIDSNDVLADFEGDRHRYAKALYEGTPAANGLLSQLEEIKRTCVPDLVLMTSQNEFVRFVFKNTPQLWLEQSPLPRLGQPLRTFFDPSGHQIESLLETSRKDILSAALGDYQKQQLLESFASLWKNRPQSAKAKRALVTLAQIRKMARVALLATQPADWVTFEGAGKTCRPVDLVLEWARGLPDGWVGVPTLHPGDASNLYAELSGVDEPKLQLLQESESIGVTEDLIPFADGLVTLTSNCAMSAILLKKSVVVTGLSPFQSWAAHDVKDIEKCEILTDDGIARLLAFLTHRYSMSLTDMINEPNVLAARLADAIMLKDEVAPYVDFSKYQSDGLLRVLTPQASLLELAAALAAKDEALAAKDEALAAKDEALAAKAEALAAASSSLSEALQVSESRFQHIRHLEQHLHLHKVEINRLRQSLYGVSWHTHLYRGWKRLVGDKQYNERANHSPKRYSNLQVPWHTHLYRAGVGLFVKGERPWHAHLFRSWQSLRGDKRYAPRATTVTCVDSAPQADDAASPAKRFARYRDEAGI